MPSPRSLLVIVDGLELPIVLKLLAEAGMSGYTVIKDATGKGDRGLRVGDDLTGVFANSYVLTACPGEKLDLIVELLRPILKLRGGIYLVSDAQWIVH